MTVHEMNSRMSSKEFAYWMAYYSIEPFGPEIESYRSAWHTATLANLWISEKGSPLKADDLVIKFVDKSVGQSEEDMIEFAKALAQWQPSETCTSK